MDPTSIGILIAGAKNGLDVIRQAAETVTAIRSAAKGPEGHKTAEIDTKQLSDLAENLIVARVRTIDVLSVAELLQAENMDLRQQLARKESFSARASHYRLTRHRDGAATYEYMSLHGDETPPHSICPNCFEGEKIRLLQPDYVDFGTTKMKCGECGLVVPIPNEHKFVVPRVTADYNPYA